MAEYIKVLELENSHLRSLMAQRGVVPLGRQSQQSRYENTSESEATHDDWRANMVPPLQLREQLEMMIIKKRQNPDLEVAEQRGRRAVLGKH